MQSAGEDWRKNKLFYRFLCVAFKEERDKRA